MPQIDARPPGLDVKFRPGTTLTLTANWSPAGILAGRTFTAELAGTPLTTPVSVVGNVMTITVTDTETGGFAVGPGGSGAGIGVDFELLEDIAGTDEPIVVGRWETSSNGSVASQQTVQVTQGEATVDVTVTGAGPLSTAIDALPAATLPYGGDELLPGLQDGVAVKFATADLAGAPVDTRTGVDRTRVRWFEDFEGISTPVATDAALIADTKMRAALAGTGAQVSQGQGTAEYGIADLATGTTATGRCAIGPNYALLFLFANTALFRVGARVKMPVVSDGTNTYQVTIGMGDMTTANPADAILFRSPTAAGNWQALIRDDSADLDVTDTGVAVDSNGAFHTFVVEFDPVFSGVRWYIDGAVVASETVNEPDALANLANWGVGIFKSAGAVSRVVEVDAFSWDMPSGRNLHNMP